MDIDRVLGAIFRLVARLIGSIIGIILRFLWDTGKTMFLQHRDARNRANPKPLFFSPEDRFEHTHIVAGSGHGKTQLLQQTILTDIDYMKTYPGSISIVVIDSQGDLINKILHLADMEKLSDRLVLIDPNDIKFPPELNLFDFGLDRLEQYDDVEREKLVNGAIALYEHIFGSLLGAELTQRQGVIFRYLARLMMVVPGANIQTLIEFLEEPERAKPYLAKLDPTSAHFLRAQFFSSAYDDTRQQILTRVYGVLSNSVLARMFNNERNKLNLFEAMNNGSIVLINTAKDLLKQEGCEILGRFFIALITQAVQERAATPEGKRRPTFVYIDEAQDYFDESMENLFTQARKYKVGLIIAHQNLDQFSSKLRATVMTNTSIKIVGGLSAKDASEFAKELHVDADDFQHLRKTEKDSVFACFIRNRMQQPTALVVPFGLLEGRPKLTKAQYEEIRNANRRRYIQLIARHAVRPEREERALVQPEIL